MTAARLVSAFVAATVVGATLVAVAAAPTGATNLDQPPSDSSSQRSPGVLVVDTLEHFAPAHTGTGTSVAPESTIGADSIPAARAALGLAPTAKATAPAGGFSVCYETSIPAPVINDVVQALETWSHTLDLSGPTIGVTFGWHSLGSGSTLGIAGPTELIINGQLPVSDAAYPIALANQLLGADANGAGCDESQSEVTLYLNSLAGGDGSLWNIGDETATEDQVDLSTVVLHEIGHGLGIVSSAQLQNGTLNWPKTGSTPYIFDRSFALCAEETSDGCATATTPVAVGNVAALEGTNLWFQTPSSMALELYAPSEWAGGSSASHLDEVRYPDGSGFSLMTPFLRRGETYSTVDPALQALVQSLGWTLADTSNAPGDVTAVAANGSVEVDFEPAAFAAGAPALSHQVTLRSDSAPTRTVTTRTSTVNVTGLSNGAVYTATVAALNSAGLSQAVQANPTRLIPLELPPFATAEIATAQLASDLLGVELTGDEIAQRSAELRATQSIGSLAAAFSQDTRLDRRLDVIRLYLGFFERDPDPAGLRYWFNEVSAGVSLDIVASSFAIASEFEQGQVVPDADFIDAAYGRILDRSPDTAGREYWIEQLGLGLDRGQMLILFAGSAEHVAKTKVDATVIALSFGLLDRSPTPEEATSFATTVRSSGGSGLAAQIVVSDAYSNRRQPR